MNPRFVKIPPLEIGDEAEQWILADVCVYQSALLGDAGNPVRVVVPVGFKTDLASIPRVPFLRSMFMVNGLHRAAAIIHDYLCRLGMGFSRKTADKIFLEAMKVSKVPRLRRRLMYWAVAINTTRLKLLKKAR